MFTWPSQIQRRSIIVFSLKREKRNHKDEGKFSKLHSQFSSYFHFGSTFFWKIIGGETVGVHLGTTVEEKSFKRMEEIGAKLKSDQIWTVGFLRGELERLVQLACEGKSCQGEEESFLFVENYHDLEKNLIWKGGKKLIILVDLGKKSKKTHNMKKEISSIQKKQLASSKNDFRIINLFFRIKRGLVNFNRL